MKINVKLIGDAVGKCKNLDIISLFIANSALSICRRILLSAIANDNIKCVHLINEHLFNRGKLWYSGYSSNKGETLSHYIKEISQLKFSYVPRCFNSLHEIPLNLLDVLLYVHRRASPEMYLSYITTSFDYFLIISSEKRYDHFIEIIKNYEHGAVIIDFIKNRITNSDLKWIEEYSIRYGNRGICKLCMTILGNGSITKVSSPANLFQLCVSFIDNCNNLSATIAIDFLDEFYTQIFPHLTITYYDRLFEFHSRRIKQLKLLFKHASNRGWPWFGSTHDNLKMLDRPTLIILIKYLDEDILSMDGIDIVTLVGYYRIKMNQHKYSINKHLQSMIDKYITKITNVNDLIHLEPLYYLYY